MFSVLYWKNNVLIIIILIINFINNSYLFVCLLLNLDLRFYTVIILTYKCSNLLYLVAIDCSNCAVGFKCDDFLMQCVSKVAFIGFSNFQVF